MVFFNVAARAGSLMLSRILLKILEEKFSEIIAYAI